MGVIRRGEGATTGVVGGVGAGVVDGDDVTGGSSYGPLPGVVSAYVHCGACVEKDVQFVVFYLTILLAERQFYRLALTSFLDNQCVLKAVEAGRNVAHSFR